MVNGMTVDGLKAWGKKYGELAMTYCKAKAFAEVERERVDAYKKPIFEKYNFVYDEKWGEGPKKITDENHLYLADLEHETVKAYFEEMKDAHIVHGWTGERDFCPALVAEHLLIDAENAILDAGTEFTGIEKETLYGDNRKKMIDLLVGVGVKAYTDGKKGR